MKLLIALLFGLSSSALAETRSAPSSTLFSFQQQNLLINLEQKDFETIYRTDQVPDTCYRDEIQGTRTECRTEYDRICDTRLDQVCDFRSFPICQTVPRRVCHTSNQCTTQMDQVCNSSGCRSVPRRVCNPTQQCSTQMDQVCRYEQRYVCQTLPRQYCQDVPRQACQQVPNIVKVAYACTRPVQVPIGQQLKLHTVADVAINLMNFAETGITPDQLKAELKDGKVTLSALDETSNQFLYQILDQKKSEQILSATEKRLSYQFVIKAISIQKLNSFLGSSINSVRLFFDRIEFSFLGKLEVPIRGNLMLVQNRKLLSDRVIINDDFSSGSFTSSNGNLAIALKSFGVVSLKSSKHTGELSLKLDVDQLKNGLINPMALNPLVSKKVVAPIDAFPAN